jgi:hypothetical protein
MFVNEGESNTPCPSTLEVLLRLKNYLKPCSLCSDLGWAGTKFWLGALMENHYKVPFFVREADFLAGY